MDIFYSDTYKYPILLLGIYKEVHFLSFWRHVRQCQDLLNQLNKITYAIGVAGNQLAFNNLIPTWFHGFSTHKSSSIF